MSLIALQFSRRALAIALLAGLAIRVAILADAGGLTARIMNEQQDSQIARSIVGAEG